MRSMAMAMAMAIAMSIELHFDRIDQRKGDGTVRDRRDVNVSVASNRIWVYVFMHSYIACVYIHMYFKFMKEKERVKQKLETKYKSYYQQAKLN